MTLGPTSEITNVSRSSVGMTFGPTSEIKNVSQSVSGMTFRSTFTVKNVSQGVPGMTYTSKVEIGGVSQGAWGISASCSTIYICNDQFLMILYLIPKNGGDGQMGRNTNIVMVN
uniref:Uncharacterized protein n=1 Tax=Romanomermis culicivorax TaxID=13658 RepID=A0A915L4R5_ROMCU